MKSKRERFLGCMYLGAIGDAKGSGYENMAKLPLDNEVFYPFGKPEQRTPEWMITDDTQLNVLTCEALLKDQSLEPEILCSHFVSYFNKGKIRGIGASTLKAFRELQIGSHWSQVGRKGDFAAGNGAAMRIASLAFFENISRERIEEVCSFTHKNSEAYIGALAVTITLKAIINNNWEVNVSLMTLAASQLPDSRVRDRILQLDEPHENYSIAEVASKFGNSGYVVNSIPFAIYAANKIKVLSIENIFEQIIQSGGDTDTNCSICGQICGAYIGINEIPHSFLDQLKRLPEYSWFYNTFEELGMKMEES